MGWSFWKPRRHLVAIYAAFVSLVWVFSTWEYASSCGACLAIGFFYGAHTRNDGDLH